jgi:hypothetical protein
MNGEANRTAVIATVALPLNRYMRCFEIAVIFRSPQRAMSMTCKWGPYRRRNVRCITKSENFFRFYAIFGANVSIAVGIGRPARVSGAVAGTRFVKEILTIETIA